MLYNLYRKATKPKISWISVSSVSLSLSLSHIQQTEMMIQSHWNAKGRAAGPLIWCCLITEKTEYLKRKMEKRGRTGHACLHANVEADNQMRLCIEV